MLFQSGIEKGWKFHIVAFSLPDEWDDRQALYKKRLFFTMTVNLFLTDLCLVGALGFQSLFCALLGLLTGLKGVLGVLRYGKLVLGDGLRSDYLFYENSLRLMECEQWIELPYDKITFAARVEQGLVLRFGDSLSRLISPTALADSECDEELVSFLTNKLGKRMENCLLNKEYQASMQEVVEFDRDKRERFLGRQLSEIVYEVDKVDRCDYCRLLFRTGKTGRAVKILSSVLGAIATAAAIFSVVTGSVGLRVVCYVSALLVICLLYPKYIGLAAPGRRCFITEADGRPLTVFFHEKGVWAQSDRLCTAAKWEGLLGYAYDKDIGMALEMDEGTVFLPTDVTSEELLLMVKEKIDKQREG